MKILKMVCLLLVVQSNYKVIASVIKDFGNTFSEYNIFINDKSSISTDNDIRLKRQVGSGNSMDQMTNLGEQCKTPYGQNGSCKQISQCQMPHLKDNVLKAVDYLCIISGNQIGICCPDTFTNPSGPRFSSIADVYNTESLEIVNNQNRPEQRGCGVTTKQFPKITEGRPAEPDEWPWMVAIIRKGYPEAWCGGTLITNRLVLTAAHCIHKFRVTDLSIRLGEYDFDLSNETRSKDYRIAVMVHHIDYDPITYENDIALLRIEKPTIFNTYVWPVCMPDSGGKWEGYDGIVTGWGTQHFSGPYSHILMEVNLPIWEMEKCRELFVQRITDNVICAGVEDGGRDSCQGDSGGPLLVQLPNRRWVIVGIVSWGIRCGEHNHPGIYTRVDKYIEWIIENSEI
ncbi:HABP2 family protein [Megaselia abdita]